MTSGFRGRQSQLQQEVTVTRKWGAVLLGSVFLCTPAYAYLDPGTGSIILQGLLAGIAVAMGVARQYWHNIKSFFSGGQPLIEKAGEKHAQPSDSDASGSL